MAGHEILHIHTYVHIGHSIEYLVVIKTNILVWHETLTFITHTYTYYAPRKHKNNTYSYTNTCMAEKTPMPYATHI